MRIESIFSKTFPASVDNMLGVVSELTDKLEGSLGSYVVTELFTIKVILNELLVNAIRHGCKSDISKNVSVNCYMREDERLILKVSDEGNGYDYYDVLQQEICDTFALDNNMKECGRGILIVKSLCENLYFNNEGNEIEVVVKL